MQPVIPANNAPSYQQAIASNRFPFHKPSNFINTIQFVEYSDFCHYQLVCKLWNEFSKDPAVWPQLFKSEGIPLVEQIEGKENDYKKEFLTLYPMTISGRMIKRLFGDIPEEIPCISRDIFEKCLQKDPFELGKLMRHTFMIVVRPGSFERTSSKELPVTLDQNGDLQVISNEQRDSGELFGQKLTIPNRFENLRLLCYAPLVGEQKKAVFSSTVFSSTVFSFPLPENFAQDETLSNKNSVYFMRKCITDESRNKPHLSQKLLLESKGFRMASFAERTFAEAVHILTFGTCLDNQNPKNIVGVSDTFNFNEDTTLHQITIKKNTFNSKMEIDIANLPDDTIGAIPCLSAEVPQ